MLHKSAAHYTIADTYAEDAALPPLVYCSLAASRQILEENTRNSAGHAFRLTGEYCSFSRTDIVMSHDFHFGIKEKPAPLFATAPRVAIEAISIHDFAMTFDDDKPPNYPILTAYSVSTYFWLVDNSRRILGGRLAHAVAADGLIFD